MKELTILGRIVQVRFVSQEELDEIGCDSGLYGVYHRQTIYINKDLELKLQQQTLFHEMIHACLEVSGLTQILSAKHEEAVCDCLESLIPVFKNEDLRRFLS